MRKVIFFIIGSAFLLPATAGAGSCGFKSVTFQGTQRADHDEFVYETNAGYTAAKAIDDVAPRHIDFDNDQGRVWECDAQQGCDKNTLLYAPKGYVWQGEQQADTRIYSCTTEYQDHWDAKYTNVSDCEDDLAGWWLVKNRTMENFPDGAEMYVQRYTACIKKTTSVSDTSSGSDAPKKDNPTGGGKASSSCTDRCRGMSGVQYTECVTCCKVSEDYADWNGSECVCADKTLDFNVLTQKCETPSEITMTLPEVVVTPECPDTQVTILNQWLIQYAGNSDVISRVQVLLDYCNGEVINITSFNQMFTELQNFIDGLATSAEQDASRRRIEESVSAINSRIGDLDVSVWRNAEGEFNTSRLLSDSIAGVVLGTAGGLITSHVVKKNNIASGFEDIKCAIGGQVVADWGDQFQVGIQ